MTERITAEEARQLTRKALTAELEIIWWVDSRSDDGWTSREDLDIRAAQITTVGFVIEETDDVLCLANSKCAHTNQLSGIMFIPKACIRKRRDAYSVGVGEFGEGSG